MLADGGCVSTAGFRYPTRMTVIQLRDGGLFIWSPVALTPAMRAEVDALGEVRFLIAPNSLHHLWLGEWHAAYPAAQVFAAPGVSAKRTDVTITAEFGTAPVTAWDGEIDHVIVGGNLITTEVVFFHRASATVVFTDLLQQFPKGWHRGWRAIVARLDLMVEAEPSVPRKFRMAFTDRRAAREAIGRILDWPAERVVMAHGTPVPQDGQALMQRAFGWLMR